MTIEVAYFGQIKAATGCASETVEAATLKALIDHVAGRHEAARRLLLNDGGAVQRALLVTVNEDQVLPHEDVPLRDGDRVTLMPPISGGARR